MNIEFDENTGKCIGHKEPYAILEIATEEDYKFLQNAVQYYKDHEERK